MEKRSQEKQNNSLNNQDQENLDDGMSMNDKMQQNLLKKEIQNKEDVQIIKIDSSSQKEDLDKIQSLLNQKEAEGGQQQQKKSIFFGSSKEQQQNQKQDENLEQQSKKQILVMDPTQVKLSVEKQIQKIKEFTSQNEDYNMQLQLLKQINKQAENGYLVYKEIARTQYILLQKINKKMKEIINQNQEYLEEQKKELKSNEYKDLLEKINKQHQEMEQNYNKLNENTFQQIELYQKQNQSDPEIIYLKAALYKLNNKIQEGVANLDQLIQLVPYDIKPIIAKGLFYREAQMYQESQKVFEQAIEQFPNRPDGYINMAYLLKQQGQQQKCMEYFEKAVNIQPAYENQRHKFQEQQEQQSQKNEKS
ncbi:hypothetical protein PPERSA_06675 [Pseudocohnilembus persalinus]|uniref:Uncharacterized protein n=1 Tax=Pseudocohnilembus persalinus TaxID=266149 RepID=A0A0V0QS90_PSEPJ|nr:hypothetical protein PPERSA_06675 [Pseudocohnilembus persalinus]|eukprot:KRX05041.1 hypothetical protein PPERSA_06675 [Pseudocohnilembus persalinus]